MSNPRPYRPNPLAAWFLLTTVAAVLMAIAMGSMAEPGSGGGIVLLVAGFPVFAIVGLFWPPRFRNFVLGIVCWGLLMIPLGLLMGAAPAGLTAVFVSSISGSVMIALIGLLGRSAR